MTVAEAEAFAINILSANGLVEHQAGPIARAMALAEAAEVRSHGLYRLIGYVGSIRSGRVNPSARPQLQTIAGSFLRVDGDNGFAPAAHGIGAPALIEAARTNGIAALALTNCYHFSALWHDLDPLVNAGLACWAFTLGQCIVAPHGGTRRLMGTNPIAFGWPREGEDPFLFDFATSVVARGEIELMRRAGKDLPEGWGLDAAGMPTRDPQAALAGALLPFGGYKGSALSMMVELLAGPLIGEPTSLEAAALDNGDGGPPLGGELLIAMSPDLFNRGLANDWRQQAEMFFAEARKQPGLRLPSDRRHGALRHNAEAGIRISKALLEELTNLASPGLQYY
ncbi:MAG TPA: Ldh family oxidoreductase [Beijerinckiaceae bacterium]|mgnify:CR=1 FL=1|nr:Ldh family oxidoreductase [Beijerinckiaceae bacterium]